MSYKPDGAILCRLGMALILLTSLLIINGYSYAQCPSGLTNYWELDESSGNIFLDSVVGGADASCVAPGCPAFLSGRIGNGLSFDGNDDGINVPSTASFNWGVSDSFSIEFWMKTDAGSTCSGNQVIVGRDDASTDLHWWVGCQDGGQARFVLIDKDGTLGDIPGTINLMDGNWHHIVAMRDASANRIRLYVDGNGSFQDVVYTNGFDSIGAALNIGWLNLFTGYHFEGVLDEVALYNRALSEAEVQQHYGNGMSGLGYCLVTLTYTAGANGSITGLTPQTVNYNRYSGTAVTAVPATNYHFVQWSDGSTDNPRTDTNVTADITVTAAFAINTYTLTYTAGANGTISGTSPQTVNYGASGTAVTAVPNTGYHFVNWSDSSTANPRTDTSVTANVSVTANFAINTYTLTYTAGANGTITGTSPQTVNHGANGTAMTAVPNTGYHFVNWSDSSTANPRTDTSVTANVSVTANFAINTYTLTYTAGANGTITGTTPQTVNHGANGTAMTAVPATNYHFVQWSDGSTANPRTDTNVTANITVTAAFAINTYTLTYTAGANGSISGTSPQTVNYGTSGTAVTAVPATNYHFVQWSDGSTANPRTDTNVTASITVTAAFNRVFLFLPLINK